MKNTAQRHTVRFCFCVFNFLTVSSFSIRQQNNLYTLSSRKTILPRLNQRLGRDSINTVHTRRIGCQHQFKPSQRFLFPSSLEDIKSFFLKFESPEESSEDDQKIIRDLYDALNSNDARRATSFFSDDCVYDDTKYYEPCKGKVEIMKHLSKVTRAYSTTDIVIDDMVVGSEGKIGVKWHVEDGNEISSFSRGCSFYKIDSDLNQISYGFIVQEPPSPKPGDVGLNLLTKASTVLELLPKDEKKESALTQNNVISETNGKVVEKYFNSWNARDLENAVSCFTDDCEYDDAQFQDSFKGRNAMYAHLNRVTDAFPETFQFVLDDAAVNDDGNVCAIWHVENNKEPLPFTRGLSFYKVDKATNKISFGFDVPEPAVVKSGNLVTTFLSQRKLIADEPVRIFPLVCWIAYIYVVFFSNGILPGADALQLEQRTWEEVRDLSINFFFVSPLLNLPFSPTVHPMLESIFNLLLSWAALFAGFLSDDRNDKPNELPTIPIVIGMQFLTSAFLLPYLFSRTSESTESSDNTVYSEDMSNAQNIVGESKFLGPSMSIIGLTSFVWAFLGRRDEFGSGWGERYESLIDLLSIDRVGSSFVVDLAIFAVFQGWLVDDDLRRRGVDVDANEMIFLRGVAKFIPFFGLAIYLTLRPKLPTRCSDSA